MPDEFEIWKKKQEYLASKQRQKIDEENRRRVNIYSRPSPIGAPPPLSYYQLNPLRVETGDTRQSMFIPRGGRGGGGGGSGFRPFRDDRQIEQDKLQQDKLQQDKDKFQRARFIAEYDFDPEELTAEHKAFTAGEPTTAKYKEFRDNLGKIKPVKPAGINYKKIAAIKGRLAELKDYPESPEYQHLKNEWYKLMEMEQPKAETVSDIPPKSSKWGSFFNMLPHVKPPLSGITEAIYNKFMKEDPDPLKFLGEK